MTALQSLRKRSIVYLVYTQRCKVRFMLSGLCGEIFNSLGTKVIAISSSIDSETSSTSMYQLEELTSLFDKYSVRYWLDSGTLLGVVRNGAIKLNLSRIRFRKRFQPET